MDLLKSKSKNIHSYAKKAVMMLTIFLFTSFVSNDISADEPPVPLHDMFGRYEEFVPIAKDYFEEGDYMRNHSRLETYFPAGAFDLKQLFDYGVALQAEYPEKALYYFTLYHEHEPMNMWVLKNICEIFDQLGYLDTCKKICHHGLAMYLIYPDQKEGVNALHDMFGEYLPRYIYDQDIHDVIQNCLANDVYFRFLKEQPAYSDAIEMCIENVFTNARLDDDKKPLYRALWVLLKLKFPLSWWPFAGKIIFLIVFLSILIFIDNTFFLKKRK
jgi:hypothetical protein